MRIEVQRCRYRQHRLTRREPARRAPRGGPVSSRCAGDGDEVTCWMVDRSDARRWRLALVGSGDGQVVAEATVVVGDTYPDEATARLAAELFEATGRADPDDVTTGGGDPGGAAGAAVEDG